MLNKVFLQGRLVADPDLRHTQQGTSVASFRLAVEHDFKNQSTGERGADFINIVAWRGTADFVSRYFSKGRMALVEGRLQMRDYTDKDGNKRIAAEVVRATYISETASGTVSLEPTRHTTGRQPHLLIWVS